MNSQLEQVSRCLIEASKSISMGDEAQLEAQLQQIAALLQVAEDEMANSVATAAAVHQLQQCIAEPAPPASVREREIEEELAAVA